MDISSLKSLIPIDVLGLKNFRIFDHKNAFIEEMPSISILTGANNPSSASVSLVINKDLASLDPFGVLLAKCSFKMTIFLKEKALDFSKAFVPPIGFEPMTYGLENRCSIQLSYGGILNPIINDVWINAAKI